MKNISSKEILAKKFIHSGDHEYPYVPLMAVWYMKCDKCGCYCVSSAQIGVHSRYWSHYEKCEG